MMLIDPKSPFKYPDAEVQPNFDCDYEQLYLEQQLETRKNSFQHKRDTQTKSTQLQTDTKRGEPLLEELTSRAQRTGVSLMAFFNVKRFITLLLLPKQRLQRLNSRHLQLISDSASDTQVLQAHLKFLSSSNFRFQNVSRLFRTSTAPPIGQTPLSYVKTQLAIAKRVLHDTFAKIPLFHPESPNKLIWDLSILLIRLILLLLIPLEISFAPQILFTEGVSSFIILALSVDLCTRLNTVCYVRGQAVLDRWQILQSQYKKTLLLETTLIFLLYYFTFNQVSHYGKFSLLIVFFQFQYIEEVVRKSEESSYFTKQQKALISLAKLIIQLIYILHIFACIWNFNSQLDLEDSWIDFKNLTDSPWSVRYLEAFYFATVTVLTIGYGDNVPKSWNEKLVAILFILGACLWFSYSVNTIGAIIKEINQNRVERSRKIRVINRYMHQRSIPYTLQYKQNRIREYLNFRWKEEAEIDLQQEEQLLNELSDDLKEELKRQANSVFFKHCLFIKNNFSIEFQNALSFHIKRQIILPQNTFSINSLTEWNQFHLCFVEQGKLQYLDSLNQDLLEQQQFLQVQDFITENLQSPAFKAIGYVSLLVLSKPEFLSVLKGFPRDYQRYCALREEIVLDVKQYHPPYGVNCPACLSNEHSLQDCSNLRIPINREVIIKRHLYSVPQERSLKTRPQKRQRNQFKAVQEQEFIESFALYLQNERPQDVQAQLKYQLANEVDGDLKDSQTPVMQKSHDGHPSKSPIFQRHDSIVLSNIQSSSSLNQSIIMVHPRVGKNKLLKSQVSLSCENQNQNPVYLNPTQNKYNTAKISLYKRNYISKHLQNSQESGEKLLKQSQKSDFNDLMIQNIEQLHSKIRRDEEAEYQEEIVNEIEILYLQTRQEQQIENFDMVKNFEFYKTENNVETVLNKIRVRRSSKIRQLISKFIQYMYYPFEYISKYKNITSKRESTKPGKKITRKSTQRLSKILELKSLVRKKILFQKKASQIYPSDQIDQI